VEGGVLIGRRVAGSRNTDKEAGGRSTDRKEGSWRDEWCKKVGSWREEY
jgi:hypothetical protein